MSGVDSIGSRVMHKDWARYPRFQYLARLGRVVRAPGPYVVEVRWDAGECGAPAKIERVHVAELAWVWWRAT